MNTTLCTLIAAAGFGTIAAAQTGTYTWQVSIDNGDTWTSHGAPAPFSTIKVRLLAGWDGITGASMGYAGGQFDGYLQGAITLDTVSNIRRLTELGLETPIVARPYSAGIKLDTLADVSEPGLGTGWINPGQAAQDFAAPGTYVTDNPAAVFFFDFFWSGAQPITIGMVRNQTPGRAMAIYTTSAGQQFRLNADQVTVSVATISLPAPASVAPAVFGLALRRRRARTHPPPSTRMP